MKELLLRAGISSAHISGHSIRKGAAVSAAANGISKEDIKLLGRWKSDAVDAYINELAEDEHIKKILRINARLHLPKQPTPTNTTHFPGISDTSPCLESPWHLESREAKRSSRLQRS